MLSFGLPIGLAGLCLLVGVGVLAAVIVPLALLRTRRKAPTGFPVLPAGPGRFRVSGVDRTTKADRVWECDADGPENAQVKAELEGIVVTRVERV